MWRQSDFPAHDGDLHGVKGWTRLPARQRDDGDARVYSQVFAWKKLYFYDHPQNADEAHCLLTSVADAAFWRHLSLDKNVCTNCFRESQIWKTVHRLSAAPLCERLFRSGAPIGSSSFLSVSREPAVSPLSDSFAFSFPYPIPASTGSHFTPVHPFSTQ